MFQSNTNTERYERKFVFAQSDKNFVQQIIKHNPAGFREIYHKRQVNNIYFDTAGFKNYYDTINGTTNRVKVRLRWYNKTFDTAKTPVLEFKYKTGLVGKKLTFGLNSFDFSRIDKQKVKNFILNSNLPAWVIDEIKTLYPVLINSYTRQYFLSFDNKYRFTLDYNLQYFNFNCIKFNENNPLTILELKYNIEHNSNAQRITNNLPVRLSNFSKYATAVEKIYPVFTC